MIYTAGNIIALSTLIAAVHCQFLYHDREIEVVVKADDHPLGDRILMTSNACPYKLDVSLEGDELVVSVWEDDVRHDQIRILGEPEERRVLKDTVVNILKGAITFE